MMQRENERNLPVFYRHSKLATLKGQHEALVSKAPDTTEVDALKEQHESLADRALEITEADALKVELIIDEASRADSMPPYEPDK